ncbi:Rpn family recombination-promoting nuclease/putative transposase, partial [Clostridium perfringens]
ISALENAEAKGNFEGKLEVAKKLLLADVDINIIISSTGLTKEEIIKIKNTIK